MKKYMNQGKNKKYRLGMLTAVLTNMSIWVKKNLLNNKDK